MTTRITARGPGSAVTPTKTATRTTPAPTRPFQQVMQAGSAAVIGSAEAAVRRLPGGPVLAAAIRPTPGVSAAGGPLSAEGSAGTAGWAGANGWGTGASLAAGGAGATGAEALGGSAEPVVQDNADRTLYYLQLQEQISAESRAYSTISNVLKARHDTIKNAIGNIR